MSRPHPERQRKGPLKAIRRVLRRAAHKFDSALVELACGHQVKSNGKTSARCDKCVS